MLQQAQDLREEGVALYDFLKTLDEADWKRHTPFKNWSPHEVMSHLHVFDRAALLALERPDTFGELVDTLLAEVDARTRGAAPAELLAMWYECFMDMCAQLGEMDEAMRLPWFGPGMGVRMFTTARQMETWAHGQDIYDLMRAPRVHTDRIKNIAVLGVKTFGWTFMNRNQPVPGDIPYVKLTAPSGAVWEWNEPKADNLVEGSAVDFCRVVTQGRNIADTKLRVVGEPATRWMTIAQCFAGPPVDPPAPGQRAWD